MPEKKKGRPSAYRRVYNEQASKLCILGATDKDLAGFFGVSEQTINSWKEKHPSFLESLKSGKEYADNRVVRALFERAIGYNHKETKVFQHNGEIITKEVMKHYPPSEVAMIYWLSNRCKEDWKRNPESGNTDDMLDTFKNIAKALTGK